MLNKKPSRSSVVTTSIISVVLIALAAFVVVNRQSVIDTVVAWQYSPSPAISSIAERTAFTDLGKRYFYASQPLLSDASEFNTHCERQEQGSAILGCYANGLIYVYNVTNLQLDGIQEVTAAHETLHAVWDRLSAREKTRLSNLLEVEYLRFENADLKARMDYYARTQPGDRINELHSIIGTEFSGLSPELETHYRQYFTDRTIVVALHSAYQSVFDSLAAESRALEAELQALSLELNTLVKTYNSDVAALSIQVTALKVEEVAVDRTSSSEVNAYNAKRQRLVSQTNALEIRRVSINTKTTAYNAEVNAYNELVVRTNNLTNSLDSVLTPSPNL